MRILRLTLIAALIAAFASCNPPASLDPLVGTDKLPSTLFLIDPSRDTTLTTPQGAILKIPRGAFDAGGVTPIQLEVKEAYTLADIIRGRLQTTSKGQLLSSGGMIYCNVAGGIKATLHKPIAVSIPTKSLQEGMQRYKGVQNEKGLIDWVDPVPLDSTPAQKPLEEGKMLFQTNCASCHAIAKPLIGPPLGYIAARRPVDWLVSFTRNNRKMQQTDDYACWLSHRYQTLMTLFPHLSDMDMAKLYRYIDNESQKLDSGSIPDIKLGFDSCRHYSHLIDSVQRLLDSLTEKRNTLVATNGPQITHHWYDEAGNPITRTHPPSLNPDLVTIITHDPVYYQFSIDSFGWYNVDLPVKGLPGVEESELTIQAKGEYGKEANVFLVIPSLKLLRQGGVITGKDDEFAFLTNDGKIPLPQGAEAYIIAMGEYKGKVIFGKTSFVISRSQHLSLDLSLVSKEEFNQAIDALQLNKLFVVAHDSKNATAIRATNNALATEDSTLAALKKGRPAHCICDCSLKYDTTAIAELAAK